MNLETSRHNVLHMPVNEMRNVSGLKPHGLVQYTKGTRKAMAKMKVAIVI